MNQKSENTEIATTSARSIVDDPEFPVRSISIFTRLQQLQKGGILTTRPIFREGMGWGQQFIHEGVQIELKIGFMGRLLDVAGNVFDFNEPTDVAINPQTRHLLASAATL